MNKIVDSLKIKLKNNREQLKFSLVVTFIFGMICHAYMFFQDSFSHDSLNEFNADIYGNEWKIQLGRFAVPLYRMITRGNITLPWLIGVISLLWIALSVFIVIKAFDIKSRVLIVLTAGLFSTNIAVIATTATYIHDLDSNMFALLLSVIAFYMITRYKYGFLISIPFISLSMGLYQSYVSVTVVLVIIYIIKNLVDGTKFKEAFIRGVKSIVSIAMGAVLYFISYKSVLLLTGIEEAKDSYNSLDQMGFSGISELISTILYIYKTTIYNLLFPKSAISRNIILILIIVSALIAVIFIFLKVFDRKIGLLEVALVLFLLMILPIGLSTADILKGDTGHDLMRFSDCLLLFLFLLLTFKSSISLTKIKKAKGFVKQCGKCIVAVSVAVILFGNVLLANQIYLKKDLEQDSALSYFTRIVDRMDSFEDYDRKSTPVVFVGRADYFDENKVGFSNGYGIMGSTGNYALGAAGPSWFDRYFEYKLHYDIVTIENDELDYYKENEIVISMPSFPDEGCMQIIDGVLVVKLGDVSHTVEEG